MNTEQLAKITEVLRDNSRGMTVTEISKEINLNRNSVAKYLEVLLISGHVEMRTYGPAKVFFLSQRVPMSALIDFSSDYILILDRDLKIIKANDNFLKLVNIELEASLGQKLKDVSLPELNTPEMKTELKDALNGKRVTAELELMMGKTKCYFNLKIVPTTFEDGLPGVTLILEDITERKIMEDELRKSEHRYRLLIESITDGVFVVNRDFKFVLINDAGSTLLGIPKEQLLDIKVTDLPDYMRENPFFRAFESVMKNRKPDTITAEHTYADGRKGWYEVRLYPVPDGVLGIVADITKRKTAEADLLRFSSAVRMSTDSVVITGLDTKILDVNYATLDIYGVKEKSDLIGRYAFEILAPEDQDAATEALNQLMEKGFKKILKFKVKTPAGIKHLDVSLGLMNNEEGKPFGFVAITRDVTPTKKTE
jgi:PAS domain S-box-containing protein